MNVVAAAPNELRSRWVFTMNNYLVGRDYMALIRASSSQVKKAVIGFETSSTNVRHLQGFIELERTQRRSFLNRLLPGAWFSPCTGN